MRAAHRHAHARGGDVQVGTVERLARFERDFVFFAVVADAGERTDLRHDVVQDRRGERAVGRLAAASSSASASRPARPAPLTA